MALLTIRFRTLYTGCCRFWQRKGLPTNSMKFQWLAAGLVLFIATTLIVKGRPTDFYPLSSVHPGQKGHGKTVFKGAEVERFEVEIIGVLRNTSPQRNIILARLSGKKIDRTGVFAGMSGSPVYLQDKLVGAVAYTFPFSKEPIAGITPIQETLNVFKRAPGTRPRNTLSINPTELYKIMESTHSFPFLNFRPWPKDIALKEGLSPSRLQPLSIPLNVSGFSPNSLKHFVPQLQTFGLTLVQSVGNARTDHYPNHPLEAGSTIAVQLIRGDMNLSAAGTVTHVSGKNIYAFGHPFMSLGYTDLPMSRTEVLAVIPSFNVSQKIAAATELVGSIKQDRGSGIMGVQGENPLLIPVQLSLHTSRNELRRFEYEIVSDSFLTPFLMALTVHNSIVSSERTVGEQTLKVKTTITIKGHSDINFESGFSNVSNTSSFAALAASSPVNLLMNSGFDKFVVEKITVDIKAVEQIRGALLEKVWQDKLEASAGEEIMLTVFLRKRNGESQIEKYPVKIPAGIESGPIKIVVADGLSLGQSDAKEELGEFIPQNLQQLIRAINDLKKNDRLYIRLYREQPSAIVEGEGLPNLPPSLLALYNSAKTSGDVTLINKVVYAEHELPATPFTLRGQREISVQVK